MDIPDRVSSDKNSPYYFERCRKIGIRLDGKVIFNGAEFCVSEGWVMRQSKLPDGRLRLERGRPVLYQQFGEVEPYWR